MLPKTESLQRREAETTNGTVVFKEKTTDVESMEFTPAETFNDYVIIAMIPPPSTTIAIPDSSKVNTDFGVIVGKNLSLPEHDPFDFGCTVEIVGRPLKTIDNTGEIISGNLSLCLYRTSSIIRKV